MNSANGSGQIRVLVSAASAIRRAGLEGIVRSAPSLKLVGSTYQDTPLAHLIGDLQPNLLVWDLADSEPSQDVLSLAPAALTGRILLLADHPSRSWVSSMLRAGIRGILPRDASDAEIIAAIHAVHAGLILLDPESIEQLIAQVPVQEDLESNIAEALTPRESEILRMLAEGVGNKEIAAALAISEHTVKFHVSSILDKLGAATRTEAVTLGLRQGLIVL
jgi:DNA-binding NarL/FixJ family response regulator